MTTQILIIDSDKSALERYRQALSPKERQWSIDYLETPANAIDAVREQAPDIVIAAFSLENGNGAELLAEIEKIAPDTQRFVTAKDAEKERLQDTFGSSFQFLPDPCPADRLITEIQRCIAIDTWLGNARIKQLVAKMGEFPSLPPIYLKVVNALNARDASAETIAHAIAGDLAISAKVLQTVNSSYYGFDEKISNISEAVSILGVECVKNLVLAIQVFSRLGRSAEQKAITDQLWHHSMSVAVTAKRVAEHETGDRKAAEEAYSAGLMHDIGKLVVLNAVPEQFAQARSLASEKSIPLWQAENVVIGCNHAETGAYVLARWGMPANLTEAVALHHEPVNSFGKRFSALAAVHIANAIVWERQKADHPDAAPCQDFLAEIGRADAWEQWQAAATGKQPEAAKSLSLKKPQPEAKQPADARASSPAAKTADAPNAAPERAKTERPDADQGPDRPSRAKPMLAVAACLAAAAAGIYFIASSDKPQPVAAADAAEGPSSSLAASVAKARELTGLSRSEEALSQIVADAKPEPATETIAAAETAPPQTSPDADPSERAATESRQETTAETAFPKPEVPAVEDSFPEIALAGIFFNADNPLASVNGKIRRVGDSVDGAQIIRIEKTQIVVRYQQEVRSIKLD